MRTWTDEALITACSDSRSLREVLRKLNLVVNGSNCASIKKHASRLGVTIPKVVALTNAEKQRNYRVRNPGLAKTTTKQHQLKNPALWAAYSRNRRAQRLGAEGSFTAKQFEELCSLYNNTCLCCGIVGKLTADHIVPLSKGGSNMISNIQPLCSSCNSKKHTAIIDFRSSS